MKATTLIFLLSLTISRLLAQQVNEEFQIALMGIDHGGRLIFNGEKHSIMLDIFSNDIKPLEEEPGCFYVDNKIVQTSLIDINNLQYDKKAEINTVEAQQKILLAYLNFGLNYIKNELKVPYTNVMSKWIKVNNKTCLLWYYSAPGTKPGHKNKNINLSMMCFSNVLNLNTLLDNEPGLQKSQDFLIKIAKTLKENNFKIDINALKKKTHPYKS